MITLPTAADQATEYEDFYETTLAIDCDAGDTDIYPTVLPSSATGFLVMDPEGSTPEIIYYNFKGANFVRVPSVTDGEGRGVGSTTARDYDSGTKIGMYSIAEFYEGIVTGKFMRNGFLEARHFGAGIDPNSWIGTGENWNYVGSNGQKEFQYVTAGDKTIKYSKGMKVRLPRVVAVGTQCGDFEASSSQYATRASVAGMTFTDDFTVETSGTVESYPSGDGVIASRFDGSNGWWMGINSAGKIVISGHNANIANFRRLTSVHSVPIGTRVHIAAALDMSGSTGAIYINGVSVPFDVNVSGTSPSSLVQGGSLQLGAINGGAFYDGLMSEVRIWSSIRSAAQIKDNYNKQLVGNEAGLVSYFKLNGNFNDSTANINHLTATNGAIATFADNPFKATEYGIITNLSFSAGNTTITIFTGVDHFAPAENLSSVSYSAAETPYGFPASREKWYVDTLIRASYGEPVGVAGLWEQRRPRLDVPSGDWNFTWHYYFQHSQAGSSANDSKMAFGRSITDRLPDSYGAVYGQVATSNTIGMQDGSAPLNGLIAITPIYWLSNLVTFSGATTHNIRGDIVDSYFRAYSAYI